MITNPYAQRFTVAPMLDWTTRHCRAFHRQLSQHAVLYTEMVATSTIIHSKSDHLYFRPEFEGSVILQLGGSDPVQFAQVGKILQQNKDKYPYVGINLNVGCPSPRVTSGSFGACLMSDPTLVADCMNALADTCDFDLSIKTRIGIDNIETFEFLEDFILTNLNQAGITDFVIHARKAYLQGLSPKENREVPPLNYQRVYDMKAEHPELNISINGGITKLSECLEHLAFVDGVMMGREAFNNPAVLLGVDALLFDDYHNDFARMHQLFDTTLLTTKEHSLYPEKVNEFYGHVNSLENRLKQSLSGGFDVMTNYDPLLTAADKLQYQIFQTNRTRHQRNLEAGARFAIEQEQSSKTPVSKHQAKGEITSEARFLRLQQLATAYAMFEALERMRLYWESEVANGTAISHLFKPILGAFNGLPGARQFRRYLSEHGFVANADIAELYYAIDFMYDKFVQFADSSM